jgi:hypothetical protein
VKSVWFALAAWPALARAAARVWSTRREPLDRRAERLRSVPRFRARWLADASAWGALAGRLGARLPLDGGPCLRRALLLQDLHARCGLEPRLAIAFRPGGVDGAAPAGGHAWATTDPAGEVDGCRDGAAGWRPVAVL